MAFVDKGVETRAGAQLHRLEIADVNAFSKAMLNTSDSATGAQLKYTVWVTDEGTPVDFKIEGWEQALVSGVSTKVTTVEEFLVTATSGVTIAAPIVAAPVMLNNPVWLAAFTATAPANALRVEADPAVGLAAAGA